MVLNWLGILCFFVQIARFLLVKEQNSDLLFSKSKLLLSLFCKERQERFTLGQKMGKAVKNCQKHGKNNK